MADKKKELAVEWAYLMLVVWALILFQTLSKNIESQTAFFIGTSSALMGQLAIKRIREGSW